MALDRTERFIDTLAQLQTRLKDTLAGFDEILDKAQDDIKPVMTRLKELHQQHEAELAERLRSHGCTPDKDGSFFSTVQRAVVQVRAAFDDIDENILSAVERGEERIEALYDDALKDAEAEVDVALLARQKGELVREVENVR